MKMGVLLDMDAHLDEILKVKAAVLELAGKMKEANARKAQFVEDNKDLYYKIDLNANSIRLENERLKLWQVEYDKLMEHYRNLTNSDL